MIADIRLFKCCLSAYNPKVACPFSEPQLTPTPSRDILRYNRGSRTAFLALPPRQDRSLMPTKSFMVPFFAKHAAPLVRPASLRSSILDRQSSLRACSNRGQQILLPPLLLISQQPTTHPLTPHSFYGSLFSNRPTPNSQEPTRGRHPAFSIRMPGFVPL